MAEPFLGQLKIVGFNFAPVGWAFCDGALLAINQNQSLFALLGTTYGGDGRSTFGLPDLRGRVPIHVGSSGGPTSHPLGQKGGEETHTLQVGEIPSHDHTARASSTVGDQVIPAGQVLAQSASQIYIDPASGSLAAMDAAQVTNAGASQGHENMMPFITLTFIIALQGLFPSRN